MTKEKDVTLDMAVFIDRACLEPESDSGYRKDCVIAWDTLDCVIVVVRSPDQAGSATGQEYVFMSQGIERLE